MFHSHTQKLIDFSMAAFLVIKHVAPNIPDYHPNHSTSLTPMTLKLQNHLPKATTQAETMNCRPLEILIIWFIFEQNGGSIGVYIRNSARIWWFLQVVGRFVKVSASKPLITMHHFLEVSNILYIISGSMNHQSKKENQKNKYMIAY